MTRTPDEVAASLHEEADRRVEARVRLLPQPLSCAAGCAACCRQLVVLSPLEAHSIRDWLRANPAVRERASTAYGHWVDAARAVGLEAPLAALMGRAELPPEEGDRLEREYWNAGLPCPFLHEERCSIYPVRPFACREHCVVSAPELCGTDPDAVSGAGTRLEFRVVAAEVGARCFCLPDVLIPVPFVAGDGPLPEAPVPEAPAEQVERETERAQRRARLALARVLAASGSHDGMQRRGSR